MDKVNTGGFGQESFRAPNAGAANQITRILNAVQEQDPAAAEELLLLVYNDLRKHAAVRMSNELPQQTLQPTALVHEAWLKVMDRETQWANRAHFFGAAAEAMRRILIDNARRKARQKHGGQYQRVQIDKVDIPTTSPEEKVLMINDALEKLEKESPEKAQVVVLKYFGGHTNREIANLLDVTERTVERYWSYAKAWLFQDIRKQNTKGAD